MFQRKRLTWTEGKTASPPPSTPSVGNVVEPSHPATEADPGADKYKTGDPGDWGDTPTTGPYPNSPPPSTPGADEAGAEHPAAKNASEEAQEMLRRRAHKAIRIVEGVADEGAEKTAMEQVAMVLMDMPEGQLDATTEVLTKLGFFTAMDPADGGGDHISAEMEAKLSELEQAVQAMKAQMVDDTVVVDESPGDDITDPNSFTGVDGMIMSEDPAVQAMYQAMMQEEAGRSAGKVPPEFLEHQKGKGDDDKDKDKEAKKAALRQKIETLKAAMEAAGPVSDTDADDVKAAKTAASDAFKKALTDYQALSSVSPLDRLKAAAKAMEDEDEEGMDDDAKEAKKAALANLRKTIADYEAKLNPSSLAALKAATLAITADDDNDDNGDDNDDNGGDNDDNGSDDKEAQKAAAAAAAAAAEQGTSPEDAVVLAAYAQDPMAVAGGAELCEDDSVLSLLYHEASDDDDEGMSDEDKAAKKASLDAARAKVAAEMTGPRPQPNKPGQGPDTLGTLTRTASEGGGGDQQVAQLSSLWATAPDVSDHFQ